MVEIFTVILGICISIIGFFLKGTMDDIKSIEKIAQENTNRLNLVELDLLNKHANLNEKFDALNVSVKELTQEIKSLNKEIAKKFGD